MSGPVLPLDHLWSLCVEEWGYLLLAGLALAVRRWHAGASIVILAIAALCAVNGVIQSSFGWTYRDVYWRTDVRIASIFISCGLYLILRNRAVPAYLPIVAGVLGTALQAQFFPDEVKYTIGTMFLAVAVATIDSAPQFAIRILASKPLTQAGLWSYSIYLWQQPFTKLLHDWPIPINLMLVLAAALTSFYVVEQPARRYLRDVWANRALEKRTERAKTVANGAERS
jgi:peptidoglycan/LPS O-acetylase OafA/YrhL